MKKVYTKPAILFDSFELSQSIAAGCEFKANQADGACALVDPEMLVTVFGDGIPCSHTTDDGTWENLCYHAPADALNGFTS